MCSHPVTGFGASWLCFCKTHQIKNDLWLGKAIYRILSPNWTESLGVLDANLGHIFPRISYIICNLPQADCIPFSSVQPILESVTNPSQGCWIKSGLGWQFGRQLGYKTTLPWLLSLKLSLRSWSWSKVMGKCKYRLVHAAINQIRNMEYLLPKANLSYTFNNYATHEISGDNDCVWTYITSWQLALFSSWQNNWQLLALDTLFVDTHGRSVVDTWHIICWHLADEMLTEREIICWHSWQIRCWHKGREISCWLHSKAACKLSCAST